MKSSFVFGATSAALLLLSACASNSSRYSLERRFDVDQQYVDAVNHASRLAGVRVTWVNPPIKRVANEGESGN